MPKIALDEIDRRILTRLQENARISNVDLAAEVGVSPSPCWRRVRDLEQTGVIARYVTLVDPSAAGLPVSVFIQVSLERQAESALEIFEPLAGGPGMPSDDRRRGLPVAGRRRRSRGV